MARASARSSSSSRSLETLMERYVRDEADAFQELYRAAYPPLHAAVSRWTRDPEQVKDVLQQTFLKLHRAKASYTVGEPVLPWLHVIAKRTLLDELRPLRQRFEVLASDGTLPVVADTRAAESVELELREALSRLPEAYREAITITKLEGFDGREAAHALHTTKAAIKQRVHRGYELLREWFAPGFDDPLTV